MPVPIVCLDEEVRPFAERFRELFSKPQYQYFVTVLLGLMQCEGHRGSNGSDGALWPAQGSEYP